MRVGLLLMMFLLTGPVARAQGGSPLSTADTISLLRSAARAALQSQPGVPPECVLSIADSLGAPIGRAFVDDGERIAHAMPAADLRGGSRSLTLVGLTTGDTVMVRVSMWGDAGPRSKAFWENRFGYRFTRERPGDEWRFVNRVGLYFADYEVTDTVNASSRPERRCLNAAR